MRKPEQRLWDTFRANAPLGLGLVRIENLLEEGFPDVVACIEGRVTLVELKCRPVPPARASTPMMGNEFGLSTGQVNFLLQWSAWGGRAIIVSRVGKVVYAHPGELAREYNTLSMQVFPLMARAVGRGVYGLF